MRRVLVDRRVLAGTNASTSAMPTEHARRAVRQPLGDLDLIEIARRVVVDRRPRQTAQVANAGAGRDRRRMRGEGGQFASACGPNSGSKPCACIVAAAAA